MNSQEPLFYEDAFDALKRGIASTNKSLKEIAQAVYPGRKPETASGLLSRALTAENMDVHVSLEAMLTIMRETRPDDLLYYLCDEFNFERPERRTRRNIEKDISADLKNLQESMKVLTRKMQLMEKTK